MLNSIAMVIFVLLNNRKSKYWYCLLGKIWNFVNNQKTAQFLNYIQFLESLKKTNMSSEISLEYFKTPKKGAKLEIYPLITTSMTE